jgi:hypothetical protein
MGAYTCKTPAQVLLLALTACAERMGSSPFLFCPLTGELLGLTAALDFCVFGFGFISI